MPDKFIAIGEESTWGTSVARTQFHLAGQGTRLMHQIPRSPTTIISHRDPDRHYDDVQSGDGKVMIPLSYDMGMLIWEYCFGLQVDAGAGPYTHTFTLEQNPYTRAASPLIGLSLETNLELPDTNLEAMLGRGMRPNNFALDFQVGQETYLDVDVIGRNVEQAQKTTLGTLPDYDTYQVIPAQITCEIDDTVTEIESLALQCQQGLAVRRRLGSAYTRAPLATAGTKRITTVTINKEWLDNTVYAKFLSGASAKLEVLGTYDANYSFVFTLPKCKITGESPEMVDGEEQPQILTLQAEYDATDSAMKLVWTNQTAT